MDNPRQGTMAGDVDPAPRLYPRLAGRPHADGQLRRGQIPVPRCGAWAATPAGFRFSTRSSVWTRNTCSNEDTADPVPDEIRHRPKQPYRAPDAASFFAADSPDWVGDVTSADAIEQTGVFRSEIVDRLLTKVRRNQGRGLSNTDNMRLVVHCPLNF